MKSYKISEKEYQAKVAGGQPKVFVQRVKSSVGAFVNDKGIRVIDPIIDIKG